jgi:hypothetical protein
MRASNKLKQANVNCMMMIMIDDDLFANKRLILLEVNTNSRLVS